MFQLLLDAADPTFRLLASDHKAPTVEPLHTSPWVAMSAMQKGIRRGDVDLATRAAAALLKADPAKLWRRIAGIVFEDVGLASVETIRLVMAATAGKDVCRQLGEWAVASFLVKRMCEAKKCRAADDLFLTVAYNHELEAVRASLAREDMSQHLSHIRERHALLGASLAALHGSGVRWNGQVARKAAAATATFDAMRFAEIDNEIVALAEQGFRRTREALPVLLPLLTLALPSEEFSTADDDFPAVVIGRDGIPSYCLDGFSYEGKSALTRFLKRNTATGRWLSKHVPAERRAAVLHGAIFRVDGGLVRQRVQWPCAATLTRLADHGYHGMKIPDPAGFLAMVRADLPTLDEERANVR